MEQFGRILFGSGVATLLVDLLGGFTTLALMQTDLIGFDRPPWWFFAGLAMALWLIVIGGTILVFKTWR